MDDYEGSLDDPASLHKYLYAANDAINLIDPSGRGFIADLVETMKTYMALAVIAFPRLVRVIGAVAEALTPLEVSASLPSFGLATGIGSLAVFGMAKELSVMRRAFLERGMYAGLGLQFETWIGRFFPGAQSQVAVFAGEISSRIRGSTVIDYIYNGVVIEVKGSGLAAMVKEEQAKQLAMFAEKEKLGLSYIFLNKPTQAQMDVIRVWVSEVAPSVEPTFSYLFP